MPLHYHAQCLTHLTLEICSCVSFGTAVALMGSCAKPSGMTVASGRSILICVCVCVCICTRVYCWFCCWQTNTGLSAPVRADPLISMETRKPADINQQGDVAAVMLRVELDKSVSGNSGQWPSSGFQSVFLFHCRFPAPKFDLYVFVSVKPTVTWFTDTRTPMAVSRAAILMA